MSEIVLSVPDGETCEGCTFLKTSYEEVGYGQGCYKSKCSVFGNELNLKRKCTGCLCAVVSRNTEKNMMQYNLDSLRKVIDMMGDKK